MSGKVSSKGLDKCLQKTLKVPAISVNKSGRTRVCSNGKFQMLPFLSIKQENKTFTKFHRLIQTSFEPKVLTYVINRDFKVKSFPFTCYLDNIKLYKITVNGGVS